MTDKNRIQIEMTYQKRIEKGIAKNMIITLSGITGVGKSYYKNNIIQNFKMQNMVIYTTRQKRKEEIDGVDKKFVTDREMRKKQQEGSLFAVYEFLGELYGYDKQYIQKNIHSVTELHYEWILDFKKKVEDLMAIYIFPTNIERTKKELEKRGLAKEIYHKRIQEIEEHQKRIQQDKELFEAFDVVFYNDYTTKSDQNMIQLIQNKLKEKGETI